jgi:predicted Zn-dependent peptidase
MDNITPHKCLIVASGVKNHQEFVDLVKERIGELLPVPEHLYEREKAKFIGGEYRSWTETPQTRITLGFESIPWSDPLVPALYVMHSLIGSSTHKNAGQLSRASNLQRRHAFVDDVASLNSHFSDSGIFGITVEGPGSHSSDLLGVAVDELNELKHHISDEELNRAKNQLSLSIANTLDNQTDRLEEIARNY